MEFPSSVRRFFLLWIEAIVIVGILVFLLRSLVISPFRVESGAMNPTLLVGDVFFGFRLPFGLRFPGLNTQILTGRAPQQGEVVTFQWPKSEETVVARVLGVPGDEVEVSNGEVIINGRSLRVADSAVDVGAHGKMWKEAAGRLVFDVYLEGGDTQPLKFEKLIVPPHQFFVITDARGHLEGLGQIGLVERGRVESRAILIGVSVGRRSEKESFFRWDRFFRAIR